MQLRALFVACMVACAAGQFGRGKQKMEAPVGSMGDLEGGTPGGAHYVDMAMKGWEELGKNPEKMQEMMASFKDPEIVAQAKEMLNDPTYMAAAKAKLAQIEAKAKSNGLLDANGQPVPGSAGSPSGGLEGVLAKMAGAATGEARDWEVDNLQRHKEGEMNIAELGMANLKNALNDPSVLGEVAALMKDPSAMADLKKMMADPTFQAQAKRVQQQMQASGDMPDFSQLQRMMAGGTSGSGGGSNTAAEVERLKHENAALKAQLY